jgi:cell division protein ZipA
MMSELRWALLLLGVVFIGALVWWELRRPRHSRGAEHQAAHESAASAPRPLREPSLNLPPMRARDPLAPHELPVVEVADDEPLVPVLEAAPGRTAAAAPPEDADRATPADEEAEPGTDGVPTVIAVDSLPRLPPAAAPLVEWPPDERRRIVALRLVAAQPERFAGRSLRQALAAEGFVLGRFAIFHKPDEEQRAVVSAASLSRPGTFDADTMDSQHYGGLSLFAVLPGPKAPPQAFDELVLTARNLNERLCGVLQDEQGSPLTPARIAVLRERLASGTAS